MKAAPALVVGVWAFLSAICGAALAGDDSSKDILSTSAGEWSIVPINHATLALRCKSQVVVVDPVGEPSRFANLGKPQLVLVTDIHGDHFNKQTLAALCGPETKLVVPAAVAEQLTAELKSRATVLKNGEHAGVAGFEIDAVAAYNTSPDRLQFHPKGRGNGYVLKVGDKRVCISGDTEDIPEMLALKNVDVAFICMNLPYTMDLDQAARAVRAFKPKVVYPYHYRGSDLTRFKGQVGTEAIEIRLRDWYTAAKM